MEHLSIISPSQSLQLESWFLQGDNIIGAIKRMRDLSFVFANQSAYEEIDPHTLVYEVQAHLPVKEGTPGGLYYGTTTIQPGKVGDEYYMTRGHLHAIPDRAEYYWGVQGEGMLILMDRERNTWAEKMFPGSLHYIGSNVAHRVANTGKKPLIFGACWPSDAGHNYQEIGKNGFSARLVDIEGKPYLK